MNSMMKRCRSFYYKTCVRRNNNSMNNNTIIEHHYPVVIVGGGPVGMILSLLLSQYNIKHCLIEKRYIYIVKLFLNILLYNHNNNNYKDYIQLLILKLIFLIQEVWRLFVVIFLEYFMILLI